MQNAYFTWQKRATALLVLSVIGLLSACNDDSANEPPSLTEEHGLQLLSIHYAMQTPQTPEWAAANGTRYCPVYGNFSLSVRSSKGTLPKDLAVAALAVESQGVGPLALDVGAGTIETIEATEASDLSVRQHFPDQPLPAKEERFIVLSSSCLQNAEPMKLPLKVKLTVRQGQREALLETTSRKYVGDNATGMIPLP